ELFLDAPAATPLLAEHFDMSVFTGSHKHDRLPIPYGKGETVSGVSRGLFTGHAQLSMEPNVWLRGGL
ncbi:hypothetical protein KXR72_19805, partial [Stutzerimonas chloritidismutans]|uniref:hypothetical protein n=1 Tax=Stutzerimonas chloritidismutans TaxID=203192 RepID=UPI003F1357ED